jgi:HAE1 family hydrophobic/amphiphilic exporter-1
LVILNQSINIFSMLGILVLFGIVKKNSILRGHPRSQPGPSAADPDDNPGFRGRHDPAGRLERHGRRHQPGDRLGHHRGQMLVLLLTLIGTPVTYSIFDDWQEARVFSRLRNLFARKPKVVGGQPAPVAD